MLNIKIVYIGAGSMDFGIKLLKDIFSTDELNGCTLSLVDIDRDNLKRVYDLAVKINEKTGKNLKIEAHIERKDALPGASFVVNSLAIERCDLWKYDFEIPKKYGIRHTLGENGGPGGQFFTLRTIPVIMDIARDIEELCPDAFFLNFSNPESRIIYALSKYTKVKCLGLCHGIYESWSYIAEMLDMDSKGIDVFAAGLNHFQWLLKINDKKTGNDLYPLLREKEIYFDPSSQPLSRNLFRKFDLYPSCDDHHIGEFLQYGWEAGEEGYDFGEDNERRVTILKETSDIMNDKIDLKKWLKPSGERAVDVITGILYNKNIMIEAGIVCNNGNISNLSNDAAVEIPIRVDSEGIHPVTVGELPDSIASLLSIQVNIQRLSVEAALNGSEDLSMQALLIDPVVNSIKAAEQILKELWKINEKYIRKCI